MKILTVNVIGIPSGSRGELLGANVFQDYDAIIIDPQSLDNLYGRVEYFRRDEGILSAKNGLILAEVNVKRREQVIGLLQRGGVVVCFMQSLRSYTYNWSYEGADRWNYVTNYD